MGAAFLGVGLLRGGGVVCGGAVEWFVEWFVKWFVGGARSFHPQHHRSARELTEEPSEYSTRYPEHSECSKGQSKYSTSSRGSLQLETPS